MNYRPCIAACSMLMLSFLPSHAFADSIAKKSTKIQWEIEKNWKLPATPIDIVHSLDGKRVFILTKNQQVLVYETNGDLVGEIPVNKGVSSIDIAPRGEKLYLINQADNSFTDLALSFFAKIDVTGSPFLGKENAPVTIAVFTDFE